ncbi:aspartate carbamoyltransferase [Paraphotobacterium marinum]|uniref:Aspartate carbamoyltransferase n=1 Tax=Paraphotobacterium marinum TaxID=1755811 RepID=A0A220VDT4_9GAMM|nr:aspartate carbamoyltransferase [Paraphotobacterium marinum]ASK78322.1 aspartate carbamoyltransferase [Paraphotobacterium marinum]
MKNHIFNKSIISLSDISKEQLENILLITDKIKKGTINPNIDSKIIASCFFEASTRTRLSFETAIQKLGGKIIGFDNDGNTSSANKGESFIDSMKIIASYSDAIIIRHPIEGTARLASEISGIPVINAGDGANQHPTQTLLDLYSIYETQLSLNNLKIAFVGDLKYGRTVHSLIIALSKFSNNHFYLLSPKELELPNYLIELIELTNNTFSLVDSFDDIIPSTDIIYMTRIQKERFEQSEYTHLKSTFILEKSSLDKAKENLKILHPLPRVDELDVNVDETPYAYYFQQAKNGLYARQALVYMILNKEL